MDNWQFEWRNLQEDFLNGATLMESDLKVGFESISNFWYAELSDFQCSTILLKFPLLCDWNSGLMVIPGTRQTFCHSGDTSRRYQRIPGDTRRYQVQGNSAPGHRGDRRRYQRIPGKNGLTQCNSDSHAPFVWNATFLLQNQPCMPFKFPASRKRQISSSCRYTGRCRKLGPIFWQVSKKLFLWGLSEAMYMKIS